MSIANSTFKNGQISKYCPRCELPLPIKEFYNCSANPDGLSCYCKACHAAKRRAYYQQNRETELERQKIYEREKWQAKKLQPTQNKGAVLPVRNPTRTARCRYEKNGIGQITDAYCRKLIALQLHINPVFVTPGQIEIKRNAIREKRLKYANRPTLIKQQLY